MSSEQRGSQQLGVAKPGQSEEADHSHAKTPAKEALPSSKLEQ